MWLEVIYCIGRVIMRPFDNSAQFPIRNHLTNQVGQSFLGGADQCSVPQHTDSPIGHPPKGRGPLFPQLGNRLLNDFLINQNRIDSRKSVKNFLYFDS
jgi:hypothetical protein